MRAQVLKELLDLWLSKNGQVSSDQLSQHVHDLVDQKVNELETRLLAKIEEKLGAKTPPPAPPAA